MLIPKIYRFFRDTITSLARTRIPFNYFTGERKRGSRVTGRYVTKVNLSVAWRDGHSQRSSEIKSGMRDRGSARGNAFAKSKSELFPLSPCRAREWEKPERVSRKTSQNNSETSRFLYLRDTPVGQPVGEGTVVRRLNYTSEKQDHAGGAVRGGSLVSCVVRRPSRAWFRAHVYGAYVPRKLGQVRERSNARSEWLTKVAFLRRRLNILAVDSTNEDSRSLCTNCRVIDRDFRHSD